MHFLSFLHRPDRTLKRKLFGYMLLLALLLLFMFLSSLTMFGHFDSIPKSTHRSLDIQLEVFQKDVSTHFDHLAAAGIRLSKETSQFLQDYLAGQQLDFSDLTDNDPSIQEIQHALIDTLRQKLLQEDCSGIFVMLNTTINSHLEESPHSRSGLYLQVNGYTPTDQNILLYRGLSDVGKDHQIMPHRKWHLEFNTDQFPGYDQLITATQSPEQAYWFSPLYTLPGTSEQVMLLCVPIFGPDNEPWGICGYEISTSYFTTYHAQPTKLDHLTALLTPGSQTDLTASAAFSCGVLNGYYQSLQGDLTIQQSNHSLLSFSSEHEHYIGLVRPIQLSPNQDAYYLAVMIPHEDYSILVRQSFLKNIILWVVLSLITIQCCLYLSRRFLAPLLTDLEQLKNPPQGIAPSSVEINDLFAFLAQKDNEHEVILQKLLSEQETAQQQIQKLQQECTQAQEKYQHAQLEISRLAYSRKQEVDPDAYQQFLAGIQTLTPTERKIFSYYLAGKTVKEIIEIAAIKESTLRYHNQNIYSKLGVNSLKQLLRYSAIMQQETN